MIDSLDSSSDFTVPADVSANPAQSAAVASKDSYDLVIEGLPIRVGKEYVFSFKYIYSNPDTGSLISGPSSPLFKTGLQIVDKTEAVSNLIVKAGYKSYEVKWDPVTFDGFIDAQIFESLTSDFATQELKYSGSSNQVTILTNNTTARYIKVITRDKWNNSKTVTYGPITPLNPDPDTSTPPSPPSGASATGSIDSNDLSGFGGQMIVSWTANTDSNTSGYIIRWTTQDPNTNSTPNWEYAQVDGKSTTSFKFTGLLLNTTYYYQITAKSPYNAISWVASPIQTLSPIVDSTAGGAWSRIKSYLSIGGSTGDLFKFGTAIPASLNFSTTTTPSLTSGTYNGTILNISTTNVGNNYWLNTGRFRVGSNSSFLYWDGLDLYTTGKINATGGSFTGDVQLNGGSLYAGSLPNSGQRIRLNSSGIFAYNSAGTQTFSLDTAGYINATSGLIGGWTLGSTSLSSNGVVISNTGQISLGDTATNSVYLSSVDTSYRLWIGSNSGSNAPFRVTKGGVLYASGATIDGNSTIAGTVTIGGSTASTVVSNSSTALSNSTTALNTANAANTAVATKLTKSASTITDSNNNMTAINAGGITVYSGSSASSGARVVLNSAGLAGFNASGVATFSIDASNGNAIFKGDLTGASGTFSGTLSSASNITAGGVLTGSDIDIANDSASNRIKTSYNRATPITGSVISSFGVNAIAMVSVNTSGVVSAWYPYLNGEMDLGVTANSGTTLYYWRNLRYTNSLILNSDRRLKRNIVDSDLGLDFINLLRPVKYQRYYIPNQRVINENNESVLDEDGNIQVDDSLNYTGSRYHYGLIAQEVKEVLDQVGIGDSFAGWVMDNPENPDSYQSLGYDKFISPIIKSIQELSNMVKLLQQEVNTLKGV